MEMMASLFSVTTNRGGGGSVDVVHLTPYFTDMSRRETIIYVVVSRVSTDLFNRKLYSELGKWNPIEKATNKFHTSRYRPLLIESTGSVERF